MILPKKSGPCSLEDGVRGSLWKHSDGVVIFYHFSAGCAAVFELAARGREGKGCPTTAMLDAKIHFLNCDLVPILAEHTIASVDCLSRAYEQAQFS